MVTKSVLEAQATVELPAREMLAYFNWSRVTVNQANYNLQIGGGNLALQQNSSVVVVGQS